MKLTAVKLDGKEPAAVVGGHGLVLLETVNRVENTSWSTDIYSLLQTGQWAELNEWYRGGGKDRLIQMDAIPQDDAVYAPLYRHPRKIWGIGMNYAAKAEDLQAVPPEKEPICFMKPDTSLIGPGEAIVLPTQSQRVTSEGELGIIIGAECKHVPESEAPKVVAGFAPTLDMTAQDIHAKNPRFLGRSKCFDTFFSFGPHLATTDEMGKLDTLRVETGLNGQSVYTNSVANMMYNPWFIVSYFSEMMTLLPGDIIMTGTPGSVLIRDGDTAECRITGFAPLVNPVKAAPKGTGI